MPPITDVIKQLVIINLMFFIGTALLLPNNWNILALYYPMSEHFEPYQLVTHMFMHADLWHIGFNMLILIFLGPMVEQNWGAKRFLFFYLFCGFGAVIAHLIVWYFQVNSFSPPMYESYMASPRAFMLGASGAVYGVIGAFGLLFPERTIQLIIPPIPLKAKYLALGLITLGAIQGVGGSGDGVAHFAHLGGAFAGAGLILYWQKFGSKL